MSIMTRLKKLEQERPDQIADPRSHAKLLEILRTNYERVAETEMSEDWLAKQTNLTTVAIAMHVSLPLSGYLMARLDRMSENDTPSGKLAAIVLGMAA